MRRLFLLLLISFLLMPAHSISASTNASPRAIVQSGSASNPRNDEKAEEDKSPTPPNVKTDYSKEPFVVEESRVRVRFENDGTGKREQFFRVRVQSEAGVQRWGNLRLVYNSASESLEVASVRVIKADGSVVTAGADAVQELNEPIQRIAPVYTDSKEKHVTVPGLRPGDVLECTTVAVVHTPLTPGQFWTQYEFQKSSIVLKEEFEIDIPSTRVVKLKTRPGIDPAIKEENGRRVYRWSSSNLVREDDEKDKDKSNDSAKKKKKMKPGDELPAVQVTSFANWEEVGRWYGSLEKDRRIPSAAVRAKAAELTKGLTTDIEKIQALYDYTAKTFRYVSLSLGMGRYQPHSADDVLHNQYGDCKDKNTLLAALLEAEGMHSSSVMINPLRKLDPDVPSPYQFNHVITMVPLGKDEVWMDTTTEVAPFRLLAYPLRKKQALVIPPDGRAPYLGETPADSPIPDSEKLQLDGKIDDAGKLDLKVAYEMRGDSELLLRQAFRSVSSGKWQQLVEGMSAAEGLGKDVSEVKASNPEATREPFIFSYRVSKTNYLDQSKKKLELRLPLPVLGLLTADPDDADSPDPIKIGPPNTRDYQIRIEFPAKYTLRVPLPFSQKKDYGDYEAIYKLEGNVLTAERKLTVSANELPSNRVQDYLAFRGVVVSDLAQHVALETTSVGGQEAAADAKPEDLIKRGTDERRNGNYTAAIDLFKRAVESDPKSKMGWNDLGLAYMDASQDDLAIRALQKQIEINPYHPRAYNSLGQVYLRERKYDDATKSFTRQIEIEPLHKYSHTNLGIAYMEQGKYDAALPELERAASVTPDNPLCQVRLGQAYLNLGQDERAMDAFDKAVKMSAKPPVWNDIAYQLTLQKAHLDVARRYAESALSTTAASLRNISADDVKSRDLGLTASLASYWDTLGWVEFADGNLEKAQKYVLSAWQLSQSAETADHLGQIYEKKGDKDRASHFYALALNARRPNPEIQTRLAALAGGPEKASALVDKNRDEMASQRSSKISNKTKQTGKADFFLLLSSGKNSEMAVEEVKFANGDEKLKDYAEALQAVKYGQTLPDDTTLKIVRRGTLSCVATDADCSFLLALPADVRSAD